MGEDQFLVFLRSDKGKIFIKVAIAAAIVYICVIIGYFIASKVAKDNDPEIQKKKREEYKTQAIVLIVIPICLLVAFGMMAVVTGGGGGGFHF